MVADRLNRRSWSDWGLVPGPVDFDEPAYSTDMQDPIAEYRASMVAEVALSIKGVKRTHVEVPSWWDWRGRWTSSAGSYIDLMMTLFDDEVDPPSFGGFLLTADCEPSELLALWLALRREFPQIWLHSPNCRFYKPGSFAAEFVV